MPRSCYALLALVQAISAPHAAAQAQHCGGADVLRPSVTVSRDELCDLLSRARATNSDGLFVSQDGEALLAWRGSESPTIVHVMSITKSVVSLAFGRLILDGKLSSVNVPVSELLPEWRQGSKRHITIWHLLSHTSGLQDIANAGVEIEPAPDAVQLAIAAELEAVPGTSFKYNNKATNLLARVVEEFSGQPLDDYLAATVFHDLGVSEFEWIRDAAGNPYAMAGLVIGARDLAKVGELLLQNGRWGDVQVVDSAYATHAIEPQHSLYPSHGLLWWLMLDQEHQGVSGFYGDGWLGQSLVVLPAAGIVAVRLIDRASWRSESDSFSDFREAVVGLVRDHP
jgi:CubicO group peptidase (beta-lactamase class C family)